MSHIFQKQDKNLKGILHGQTKSSIPSKTAGAPKSIIELQVLLPTVVVLAQQAPQYHIQVIYNSIISR